jgi:SdrD B-like protein
MSLRSQRLFFPFLIIVLVLLPVLVSLTEFASAHQTKVEGAMWDVKLATNAQANSNLTVQNECKQSHSFKISLQDLPYLRLPANQSVTVPGRSSQDVPVRFDTKGMNPGEYRGAVGVACENCGEEQGCHQDRQGIPVRLTVTPPAPDQDSSESCSNDKCKVNTVILNTGFDQTAGTNGAPYAPVQPDGYWELVDAPNPNLAIPTPAWVINHDTAWATLPNSNWISAYNNASFNDNNPTPDKPYSFQRCFCTCPGIQSIDLNLQMLVDNVADVYFDNVLIGSQTNTTTSSFNNPPFLIHPKPIPVRPGKHCLRVDVRNLSGVAMGLDIVGTAKSAVPAGAPLFLSPACCSPSGKIMGRKIDDANCNGKDDNDPGLPGWIITATNTSTGATVTATTDANGFYYFNNLTPGTYTIAETPQTGWSQTMPGGGTYTVVLGANQVIQKDFANCKKGEEGCAEVRDKEILCQAKGGYGYTFNVTNKSGKDVQEILLTPPAGSTFTLNPHDFNLSTPLHNGQSTTLTVNIGNVKPGDKVCFFVTLMSKDGPCCTVEVCPVLPDCCATVSKTDVKCNPNGSYTYFTSITNNTPNTIQNIYFHPPSGVTMTPDYFAVNLAPGATFQTPPITITGASPGAFGFDISLHTAEMKACCTVHVSIDLPACRGTPGIRTLVLLVPTGTLKVDLDSWKTARPR